MQMRVYKNKKTIITLEDGFQKINLRKNILKWGSNNFCKFFPIARHLTHKCDNHETESKFFFLKNIKQWSFINNVREYLLFARVIKFFI